MAKIKIRYEEPANCFAAVVAEFSDEHGVERDDYTCIEGLDEIAACILLAAVHDTLRAARGKREINVTVTEYEGDDFPEAVHYDAFVSKRLGELYPGHTFNVSFGPRVFCPQTFEHADDVVSLCKVDLWDEFCEHGFKTV